MDGKNPTPSGSPHILNIACAENLSHPNLLRRKDSGFA